MSTTPTVISADQENLIQRAKSFTGAVLFLLVQRFPKLLQLHRNEKSWTLFRVALGCFGAALVVLPLSLWSGWITAIFGLALFVISILLPPTQIESDTDRKARELGASIVISGGEYRPVDAPTAEVRLFISNARIWAMDKHFEPLLVIPTAEIARVSVESSEERSLLRLRWANYQAEFCYEGFFAERFARLAENSVRAVAPVLVPTDPISKAARA